MTRTTSFPPYRPTSGNLVRTATEQFGDKTFLVLDDQRVSYAEMERRSARLAKGLLASGAGKGSHVGLLAPNTPEWVAGWFAITRIGGIAVMLNTYSKARELSWTMRHGDVGTLLTVDVHLNHDYLRRVEEIAPSLADDAQRPERLLTTELPYLRSVWVWGDGERPWTQPVDALEARSDQVSDGLLTAVEDDVSPADPMAIVYSSGSTSDPKGTVHSHGAIVRHAHNLGQMRDLRPDDVIYTNMPMFWVGGFSYTLVAAMHVGATLLFEQRFDPPTTLDMLERERATQMLGWPHGAKALAEHPSYPDRDLSSLRDGTLSILLPPGVEPDPRPRATSLGMTETLGPHTMDKKDPLPAGKEGSFGLEVPGTEHRIADPVTGEALPTGEVGEIWVRGYSLMLGLHKRDRADVFTPDGWYRTGDAGRFDEDGHLFFTGRMGDIIKSSGMNITPRDVELALEAMPEVAMAYVCGIDHPDRGQDVVAAIALVPGETLTGEEARVRMKDEIASYKVPRHITVYASQQDLPWLDSGKVDRRRLTAVLHDDARSDGGAD